MNYNVEKQKGAVKINFALTSAEWDEEINKAYLKTRVKFNIPGFRKGHATRKVIESMYGKGVFFDDAFNDCFQRVYYETLSKETEIHPVDDPKVDFGDMDDKQFTFSATVTVKPEVSLGQYKGLEIPKSEVVVTKEEVDSDVQKAQERASRNVDVTDRAVRNGDTVKLDYSGSVDGVKFEGGTAQNQELVIGSNTFIPGFEEQMVGMNVNDNKDLHVKFPEDYHSKDLAGKEAVFNVTVHGITVKETPEINDEFVKEVSKFDNLNDYKADVEAKIKERKQREADRDSENALLQAVADNASVEVPQCMIDTELEYMLKDFEYQLSYMYGGMKIADYFKYTGTSEQDFKKQRQEAALTNVKTRLALEEIIKQEKLEVTEKELDEELDKIAVNANKDADKYKSEVSDRERSYIKSDLLMKKVMDFLKENTKFVQKAEDVKSEGKGAEKKPAAKKTTAKTATDSSAKKPATKKTTAKKDENA